MRSRAIVALVCVGACSPETVPRPAKPPADYGSLIAKPVTSGNPLAATELERQIAAKYLAALSAPDFAGLAPLLDEDAHFVLAGDRLDSHGRREILAAHTKLFGTLAPRKFAARRVLITDRTQAIEWTLTGNDKATQKPVGINGIALAWTKDDGTLSDLHLYFDEGLLHAQLGGEPKVLQGLPLAEAPSGPPEIIEQAHTPDEAKNAQLASDWLDYLEKQEPKYLDAMAADVDIVTPEGVRPMHGLVDARGYYKSIHKAIGNIDTQLIPPPLAAGDYVAVEYRIVGEMRDKIAFVPRLNVPLITLYVVDVLQMRDGKIARVWRYDDPLQIVGP
jgi:ketosteroid isomerase-like protein